MILNKITTQKWSFVLMLLVTSLASHSQMKKVTQPKWWFGESGAMNLNQYRGTTQKLNNNVIVPTAFHEGNGVRPYLSILAEYRPNVKLGGMLNIAFDNRGGKFENVMAPCNCEATLSTNISYLTLEPSVRFAPFSSAFYVFAGPSLNFNVSKKFSYTQEKQSDVRADWSEIRNTSLSAQAGAGIDILLSAKSNSTPMTISPFVSFLTDIGHAPRKIESWSFYTIRTGIALKFGSLK